MLARTTPETERFAPTVWILSTLLLGASAAACLTALVTPELIHGPAVMVGSMRGTALVMVILGIPLLITAMAIVAVRRGGLLAVVGWIAGLVFLTYQAWMFLFAVPFNGLFPVYVAMLASGFWAVVVLLMELRAERVADAAGPRMPRRMLAGWMVASCVAFYALWLRNVVPAMFDSQAPAFLDGTGMVTATNYVLDMAFFLPFTIAAAVALWRRTPWGVVLGGAMLVVLVLESVAIAVDQWVGSAADPASAVASAALAPMFAVVALIGAVMVGLWYRGTRRATEPWDRSRSATTSSSPI
jgi:hypothetical protein